MKICKFCGHPHDENILRKLKRPRSPVTQRAEDIIERRPPTYKILTYDLSKPRVNELQNFSADVITVIEAVPAGLCFSIRVNHHESDEIPLRLGRSINIPFTRFFLSTPAHSGGSLKLLIGGELGEFGYQSPDIAQEIITDPKISAIFRRDVCWSLIEPVIPMGNFGICWVELVGGERSFMLTKVKMSIHPFILRRVFRTFFQLDTLPPPVEDMPFYFSIAPIVEPGTPIIKGGEPNVRLRFACSGFAPDFCPPLETLYFNPEGYINIDILQPFGVTVNSPTVVGFLMLKDPVPGIGDTWLNMTVEGYLY